jgi:hypothetical protein
MRSVTVLLVLSLCCAGIAGAQTHQGTQQCQACHSGFGGTQYTSWAITLHNKIHLAATDATVRPLTQFTAGDSISMGSSYGNAKAYVRKDATGFYVRIGAGGQEYKIIYTYGFGFKQRYLVKIGNSYYIPPIQWNLKGYNDNSSGTWASYNPNKWFKADGSLLAIDNSFRKNSWDKNCMGCHVTGGKVDKAVAGADTGWVATWANSSSDANMTVGCEACHGPSTGGAGKGHQMNPSKLTTKVAKLEVCGQCHNRAESQGGTHEYPKNEAANTYFNPADPSKPLAQFLNTTKAPNATGGRGTWPDETIPRQHHQQYHDLLASAHFTNNFVEVTCFTCHETHRNTANNHQVADTMLVGTNKITTKTADNTFCLSCHAGYGPFALVKMDWVKNPVAKKDSIAIFVKAHTKHKTYDPDNQANTGGTGNCITCHMTKAAVTAVPYDISVHTFAVIPPKKTKDYSTFTSANSALNNGVINSCAFPCHRNGTGAPSAAPKFGIGTDATLTNWKEATDVQLADTLIKYYDKMFPTTAIQVASEIVPSNFILSQNYPNPFNPTTKIEFQLPRHSSVKIAIFNTAGQLVRSLINAEYEAGTYRVDWNSRNDYNEYVASGTYFYRLETGSYSATKKMSLMR